METREALLTRRTVHFYRTDPLPEGALERALEAAIRAPNHKLTNPWRFTRLGPEARGEVTELGVSIKCGEEAPPERVAKVRKKLSDPPELIVVSQVLAEDELRRREDYAAVACAIQNASLSLWCEGVGSKWSTGRVTRQPETYEIAQIDPARERIVGFLWAGYAARTADSPRLPLEQVMRQVG